MESKTIQNNSANFSQSLARGMSILEIFSPELKSVTTSEAAEIVNISRSAARRYLLTLSALGYLEQTKSSFMLTEKAASIGQGVLAGQNRWILATSFVIELSNRMNEPVSVSILDGLNIRFVARDQKRRIHAPRLRVGSTLPAHCSAAGKVLLSSLASDEVDRIVKKHGPLTKRTPATITDLNELKSELRSVRLQSWATVEDEWNIGTIGIAVPIFGASEQVVAALAVGSHKERRSVEELKTDFLPVLQHAADQISAQLT